MRPRREILLLMRNELELGQWRMKLELWGYRVTPCLTLAEALECLRFPIDLVVTSIPGSAGADRLAKSMLKVLLFDVATTCPPGLAIRTEPRGPVLAERVREAVKMLTERKRGPTKKPPASGARNMRRRRSHEVGIHRPKALKCPNLRTLPTSAA